MQNDKHPPPLDPGINKDKLHPVRNDQPEDQKEERLWKHESEVPDPTDESRGTSGRGERQESNY